MSRSASQGCRSVRGLVFSRKNRGVAKNFADRRIAVEYSAFACVRSFRYFRVIRSSDARVDESGNGNVRGGRALSSRGRNNKLELPEWARVGPNSANFIGSVYNFVSNEIANPGCFDAHHAVTNYRVSQLERNYPFAQQMKRFSSLSLPLHVSISLRYEIVCAFGAISSRPLAVTEGTRRVRLRPRHHRASLSLSGVKFFNESDKPNFKLCRVEWPRRRPPGAESYVDLSRVRMEYLSSTNFQRASFLSFLGSLAKFPSLVYSVESL